MTRHWLAIAVALFLLFTSWPGAMLRTGRQHASWAPLDQVLMLVIDHPSLAQYLHPESPGRIPLVLSDHLLPTGLLLTKFGAPVVIARDSEIGSAPHIRVDALSLYRPRPTLALSYEVEGVHGRFTVGQDRASGEWRVIESEVWEE